MGYDEDEYRRATYVADNYEDDYEDEYENNYIEDTETPVDVNSRTRNQLRHIKRIKPNEHEFEEAEQEIHRERMSKFRSFFGFSNPEVQKEKSRRVGLSLHGLKTHNKPVRTFSFPSINFRRSDGGGSSGNISLPSLSDFLGGAGTKGKKPPGGFFFDRF